MVSARRRAVSSRVGGDLCARGRGGTWRGLMGPAQSTLAPDSVSTILAPVLRGEHAGAVPSPGCPTSFTWRTCPRLADAHLLGLVAALHRRPPCAASTTSVRLIRGALEDLGRGATRVRWAGCRPGRSSRLPCAADGVGHTAAEARGRGHHAGLRSDAELAETEGEDASCWTRSGSEDPLATQPVRCRVPAQETWQQRSGALPLRSLGS